jgi:dipeptidyl aminopeptidase/acylaminoacyl peptidase
VPCTGRLVFVSSRHDTNGDGSIDLEDGIHLYAMDLASEAVNQLTTGNHMDVSPSWSPDGRRIAFVSNRGGNFELFTINADGSELRQLTHTPEDEGEPTWSPDGSQIAYVVATTLESGVQEKRLFLTSADGTTTRQLTDGPGDDSRPHWFPGKFLAFEREMAPGDSSIYIWDAATDSFSELDLPGVSPAVSYDVPIWVPREGGLLSLMRVEILGDIASIEMHIFEVGQRGGVFTLHKKPAAVTTNFWRWTWGLNGEWLIGAVQTDLQATTREERLRSNELIQVRVRLRGRSDAFYQSVYNVDEKLLTRNQYYDSSPDWTP